MRVSSAAGRRSAGVGSHPPQPAKRPDRGYWLEFSLEVTAAREADERRMKALGLVAGGLAHVLNNAMTVVLGNLELQAASPDTPDGQFLATATAAARKAAAARPVCKRSPAVGSCVRDRSISRRSCRPTSRTGNGPLGPHIRFTVHTPPGLWQVSVDPDELDVAIHHLLDNARRAAPGGQVTVGVRNVAAGEGDRDRPSVGGEWVEVSVHDKRNRHDRGGPPTGRRAILHHPCVGRGCWVGAELCVRIRRAEWRAPDLISEPGKGTTVALRFPRLTAPPGPPPAGTARPPRVLVVEDEAGVRALFTHLLQASGFQVVAAERRPRQRGFSTPCRRRAVDRCAARGRVGRADTRPPADCPLAELTGDRDEWLCPARRTRNKPAIGLGASAQAILAGPTDRRIRSLPTPDVSGA